MTRFGDFWTLGNFLKPLASINLHKSPTFLSKFCKGVKIFHFSSEIILGQLLWAFGDFLLVTLLTGNGQYMFQINFGHWPVDSVTRLCFQYLALYSNKNLPKSILQLVPNWVENFAQNQINLKYNILKCLPKWRNFAKSDHTDQWMDRPDVSFPVMTAWPAANVINKFYFC